MYNTKIIVLLFNRNHMYYFQPTSTVLQLRSTNTNYSLKQIKNILPINIIYTIKIQYLII